jgi:hypothetical protein
MKSLRIHHHTTVLMLGSLKVGADHKMTVEDMTAVRIQNSSAAAGPSSTTVLKQEGAVRNYLSGP